MGLGRITTPPRKLANEAALKGICQQLLLVDWLSLLGILFSRIPFLVKSTAQLHSYLVRTCYKAGIIHPSLQMSHLRTGLAESPARATAHETSYIANGQLASMQGYHLRRTGI
jgi:hypothetical protein